MKLEMLKCLECNQDFEDNKLLHLHLRSHGLTMAKYYQTHYPRFDIYDKSLIKFKDKEFYFNNDFNTKSNMRLWISKVNKEEVRTYVRNFLIRRKKRKNLIYAPCQVELQSLPLPDINYLNELFGDYCEFVKEIGLKPRFNKLKLSLGDKNISNYKIIIDTREERPLEFSIETEQKGLSFGDYRLNNDEITCNCYIERKSLGDFYSTLMGNFNRFKREIQRANTSKAYLVVVVESELENVYNFLHNPKVRGKITMPPECIFHNMRELLQEFTNLQFLFVKDRKEASRIILRIFSSNCEYKEIDLQACYDLGYL